MSYKLFRAIAFAGIVTLTIGGCAALQSNEDICMKKSMSGEPTAMQTIYEECMAEVTEKYENLFGAISDGDKNDHDSQGNHGGPDGSGSSGGNTGGNDGGGSTASSGNTGGNDGGDTGSGGGDTGGVSTTGGDTTGGDTTGGKSRSGFGDDTNPGQGKGGPHNPNNKNNGGTNNPNNAGGNN